MLKNLETAWKRIEAWYGANVPSEHFSLAPGATAEAIKPVESELKVKLPEDVKASYRLHNGSSAIFPYGEELLTLDQVVYHWQLMRTCLPYFEGEDAVESEPEGPIKHVHWSLRWVPFTGGDADHRCIDLDPDESGTVGQIIEFYHETGPSRILAKSFESWLTGFAEELEKGVYRFDAEDMGLVCVTDRWEKATRPSNPSYANPAEFDLFWEITVKGVEVAVRFGSKGTKGETKTLRFADGAAALEHVKKLTAEQHAEGYIPTTRAGS